MHLLVDDLVLIVALHEVGDAACCSRIQHLLAVLRLLRHHLVVLLLLLLQLVIERLELSALVARRRGTEHRVDILSHRHFWTETVHLVHLVLI